MFNIDNGYLEGLCRGFKNGEGISEVNWAVIFLSSYNFDKRNALQSLPCLHLIIEVIMTNLLKTILNI